MICEPPQETPACSPGQEDRLGLCATTPQSADPERLGSATRSPCATKNRPPLPQLEKNPSSDKDPERPKQVKLIKREKEHSPAPTLLAPQVCSPSSRQARAGGRSPWVHSLSPSLQIQVIRMCILYRYHFPPTVQSLQLRRLNKALSGSPLSLQRRGKCPRTVSLCSQALRKPPSQALPTTVWGLLPSRPSVTHVPAKPQDKPGPSCHWRARQEQCAGFLTPSPLKTPPLTSKTQGPRSSSTPETARPPFPGCLGPHPALSQRQGLLSVRGHETLSRLSSARPLPSTPNTFVPHGSRRLSGVSREQRV